MLRSPLSRLKPLAACLFMGLALASQAQATTQVVTFNVLNASATLPTPFLSGDNLRLNTLVTTEVGALLQVINFTVGAGVGSLTGEAAWEISSATGTGPRLIGVNLDIFDASNALVTSDVFSGVLAGFALSTFNSPITPGNYHLVATGTGVRDSSLDVTLSFVAIVPEPGTAALMLAGLVAIGQLTRRRQP